MTLKPKTEIVIDRAYMRRIAEESGIDLNQMDRDMAEMPEAEFQAKYDAVMKAAVEKHFAKKWGATSFGAGKTVRLQKEIFLVVKNDGRQVIFEHLNTFLDWLDDPTAPRAQMVWHGRDDVDNANPLIAVGETIWWSPDFPQVLIECTHLDDIAKRDAARARAAIATLPPPKAGDRQIVVLWEEGNARVAERGN
jgi:hypothetical protein